MTLAVLFDDVTNIIRLPSLLEFSPSHKILDFPYGSYRIFVSVRKAAQEESTRELLDNTVTRATE